MKRLLHTTAAFDDAMTQLGIFIYDTLIVETDNEKEYTFYFFQDLTFSLTDDPNKDKIGRAIFCRNDFLDAGYTANKPHVVHYLRSVFYGRLAKARTLRYFNKIIFKT